MKANGWNMLSRAGQPLPLLQLLEYNTTIPSAVFLKKSTLIMANDKECKHEPKVLMPLVNLSKCEGKTPCVKVCPYDVFEIRDVTKAEYQTLTVVGKIKTWVRGSAKAFPVRADQCHACGLCVTACPEKAISLVRYIKE